MSKCNGVSVLVDERVKDLLLNFPNHVHCRLCGRVMYVDYVTVNGMKGKEVKQGENVSSV